MARLYFTSIILFISSFDYSHGSQYIREGEKTPAFKDYEMFQDIFPLTLNNFTEMVLQRQDPWVVLFHSGVLDRSWKSMAVSLRGVLWVGMIDVNKNKKLLEQIDYKPLNDTKARVYKYGTEQMKLKSWQRVSDPNTARSMALKSIPDHMLTLSTDDLEDFLVDSFMSKPSRMPAVFITEEKDSSALMKALDLRFKKYFNFGKMVQPSLASLRKLGMDRFFIDMPSLVVLAPSQGEDNSPKFSAIPFDKKGMGELNYPNILVFLFTVNREFRHLLPGDNRANERATMEMDDITAVESLRFNIQGLGKYGKPGKPEKSKKAPADEDLLVQQTVTKHGLSDEL